MKLAGKVAFITGAGSGIGAATARLFAENGATVIGADISEGNVKEVLAGIDNGESIALDVSDSAAVREAFAHVESRYGALHVLVNAAGINAPTREENQRLVDINVEAFAAGKRGEAYHPDFLSGVTDEHFDRVLAVNLKGPFYTIREAAPLLKRSGGGSIVNISSVSALVGTPMPLYYPASKAGVLGMTRAAAGELAPYDIRVNAVCPGAVDTPLLRAQPDEIVDSIAGIQLISHLATPEDLAATMLFLACDDSKFYTGQTLSPSGGLYM
ncbi:SDR family NAD(P)-dependent oxidoreductase [Rhodococcus sp. IEGM 1370]|uniref:SDR family NAD(P)-dependent oxidoreductase n=1 Tax=Rhodococcus sp. IEGM 1370 TaxID=3082222 RepID=UPI00295315B9|nr:SDR family NAD(P)-dependent oxidoreductase [Rhodococcus sp. IEGM 1370]MDV8079567.1 SDR family NAD(P)-dependent oxidoreductase [Rhodococcus sp. IEGM 1370]